MIRKVVNFDPWIIKFELEFIGKNFKDYRKDYELKSGAKFAFQLQSDGKLKFIEISSFESIMKLNKDVLNENEFLDLFIPDEIKEH